MTLIDDPSWEPSTAVFQKTERVQKKNLLSDSEKLQLLGFDTSELPVGEQFKCWCESFSDLFTIERSGNSQSAFRSRQMIANFGSMALCILHTENTRIECLQSDVVDQLDHWVIVINPRGRVVTSLPDCILTCPSGMPQVFRLNRRWSITSAGHEIIMLFVPRSWSAVSVALEGIQFPPIQNEMGQLLSEHLIALSRHLAVVKAASVHDMVELTRDIIFECAAGQARESCSAILNNRMILFEKTRRLIQSRLLDCGLCAQVLQRELGLSRSSLYRLFEPYGGVQRYIQHRRLIDAHAALSDPDDHRPIFEIAEERGYNDGSEFSRAFKKQFGYSPRVVRDRHHKSDVLQSEEAQPFMDPKHYLKTVLRNLHA